MGIETAGLGASSDPVEYRKSLEARRDALLAVIAEREEGSAPGETDNDTELQDKHRELQELEEMIARLAPPSEEPPEELPDSEHWAIHNL